MRKLLTLLSGFSLFCFTSYSQSIGVNTDASLPHASAMLDVKSTNKGLLIPRVTLTGTNDAVTIGSPALSLMVYNTATAGGGGTAVTPGFYFWNGTAWERMASAAGIGGSGTINFVPKFTAATTLGNSAIFESGGNTGIGTTSPTDRLEVARDGSIDLGIHFGWNKMVLTNLHNMGVANNAGHSIGSKILFKGFKDAALSSPQNIYSLGIDVFGNTTSSVEKNNFFIRDEYAFGTPVRMMIDATGNMGIGTTSPAQKLHVAGNGHFSGLVGIGTSTPLSQLHIESSNPISEGIRIFNTSATGDPTIHFLSSGVFQFTIGVDNDDADKLQISAGSTLNSSERLTLTNTGNVGIGITSPLHPLHMGSGAHVTSGGVWTDASSREYKENINTLEVEEALETLRDLEPLKFKYKTDNEENHLGFIAEDVPELVATKDRKGLSPMDIVAVLTKVVQQQQKRIEALEAKLSKK